MEAATVGQSRTQPTARQYSASAVALAVTENNRWHGTAGWLREGHARSRRGVGFRFEYIKVHCWSLCLSSIHIYSTINQAALLFIRECGTVNIL